MISDSVNVNGIQILLQKQQTMRTSLFKIVALAKTIFATFRAALCFCAEVQHVVQRLQNQLEPWMSVYI